MAGQLRVLGEESVFVRNTQVIQHGLDQVQIRRQDRLGQIGGEIVVAFAEPLPDAGLGFAQSFRVEFVQMEPRLHPVEKLVRLQPPHRNRAQQLLTVFFAQPEEDIAKLH